ncbi:TSUP family transporter [Desulfurivibrio alkaliphilus]|uniref:Probable membrane transporter protein n=1 Tax=Desulfurivibrio alkaliphilus (strain DSM 19089 / UNIQEM U267 / AHT2) TaxID=589865 RepID=D6Z434_DESAT|nr:TSUP family transporter [Desulfurivibrio alkaliphilus]ADH86309.1 protein of unknown function DUF81 [Desulfurivibrio alkaliphilus AHT 2]
MLSHLIIAVAALGASTLTLYSGFGLGTLLLPVFALFYPVETAVAATAVVHLANNIFKIGLVGKMADRSLVLGFGLPALLAAFAGAALLGLVAGLGTVTSYQLGALEATVTPIKLLMGLLILAFSLFELLPGLRQIRFDRRHLTIGGLLSGFFGGLSGHQGALRSAFLVKTGVDREAFVGTNAVIAFMVDVARLLTYGTIFVLAGRAATDMVAWTPADGSLVFTGIAAAFIGAVVGKRLLPKVTMATIRTLTGTLLVLVALGLISGLI